MSAAVDLAVIRLKVNEGYRSTVYVDSTGHKTVGYGYNIDAGISKYAAGELLLAQIQEVAWAINAYWWAKDLDDARLSVIIEIAFNVGIVGLLHFPKMLAAVGAKNWQAAHDELLNSDAARLLPARYSVLARMLIGNGA